MKAGRVALKPGKKQNICPKKEEESTEAIGSQGISGVGWGNLEQGKR